MDSNQYIDQISKPMVHGSSLFGAYELPKKKVRNLGPRQQLINRISYELGIPDADRSGLFWQCQGIFTDKELIALRDTALGWEGKTLEAKRRWFRSMVKEKREQIKATLK